MKLDARRIPAGTLAMALSFTGLAQAVSSASAAVPAQAADALVLGAEAGCSGKCNGKCGSSGGGDTLALGTEAGCSGRCNGECSSEPPPPGA